MSQNIVHTQIFPHLRNDHRLSWRWCYGLVKTHCQNMSQDKQRSIRAKWASNYSSDVFQCKPRIIWIRWSRYIASSARTKEVWKRNLEAYIPHQSVRSSQAFTAKSKQAFSCFILWISMPLRKQNIWLQDITASTGPSVHPLHGLSFQDCLVWHSHDLFFWMR